MRTRHQGPDDSGLTIVELVIYMTLTVVVGTIVISMFVNTIRGQESITSVTEATTRGQVVAQSIEKAVRNSSDILIEDGGATLKVLTTLDEPCQAWRVRVVGGETVLQISTGAGFASWKTFATDLALPLGSTSYFANASDTLDYALAFTTANAPVNFTGEVLPRNAGGSVGASCS